MLRRCVVRLILIGVSVLALTGCSAATTPTPLPTFHTDAGRDARA